MHRTLTSTILFIIFTNPFFAQENYFQQEVNYSISVELDDENHMLYAHERIEYFNNSPQLLNEIYFHIWPNAYKDNSTAFNKQSKEDNNFDFNYAKFEDRGYIDSLSFTQDGIAISYEETNHPDIIKLILAKPVLSAEMTVIETPFRVKVPDGRFSRLGHTNQAYYITQWYPKPAVYDQNGWHDMPYLNQGEFYSEFGSFEVKITLPENYVLGATGDLQEQSEKEWLREKAKNDAEVRFGPKYENSERKSSEKKKTLTFKQTNIHDFAWFADKYFYVLRDEVILPNSKDTVEVWAMFTRRNGELWEKIAIEALKDGVYYYSLWNGDYPYKHCTAIDGTISAGGGMEYPNITIIGNSSSKQELERVIVHEVGHNWFYGILGSNERDYPWMDEGINSYYEHRYFDEKYPNEELIMNFGFPISAEDKQLSDLSYFLGQSRNSEQAIQCRSNDYSSVNYGSVVYEKASFAMHYLAQYLGEEEFDRCMQNYYEKWKFKHPGPQDMWAAFQEITDKDVSWFFEKMLHFTTPIDHRLCRVHEGKQTDVVVKNMGRYPTPVAVGSFKEGKLLEKKWLEPFEGKTIVSLSKQDFDEIRIDPEYQAIQANRKNDLWRRSALIHKWETIKPTLLTSIRERRTSKINLNPLMGFNSNDGYLLGMSFNNLEPIKKTYEFNLAPLYGFESNEIVGYGRLSANLKTNLGPLKFTELFGTAASFSFKNTETEQFKYEKFSAGFEVEFRPKRLKTNNIYKFKYEYISKKDRYEIAEIRMDSIANPFLFEADISVNRNYHDLLFSFDDNNTLVQNHLRVNFRIAPEHQRLSLDHTSRIYYQEKRAADIRVFAGQILGDNPVASERFYLTGNNSELSETGQIRDNIDDSFRSGGQDYLYQDVLVSRTGTSGLWSNQLFMNQGAFKIPVQGLSNDWMLALNLDVDLPIPKLNFGFFTSLGWTPERTVTSGTIEDVVVLYQEYGLKLTIVRDYFTIYFPLFYDNDGDGEMDQSEIGFGKSISFDLNLKDLSPRKLRDLIPY